eukprot:scaffold30993_cov242-Isochrysis_galbana.AAC.5
MTTSRELAAASRAAEVASGASSQSRLERSAPVRPESKTAMSGRQSGTGFPSRTRRVAVAAM